MFEGTRGRLGKDQDHRWRPVDRFWQKRGSFETHSSRTRPSGRLPGYPPELEDGCQNLRDTRERWMNPTEKPAFEVTAKNALPRANTLRPYRSRANRSSSFTACKYCSN